MNVVGKREWGRAVRPVMDAASTAHDPLQVPIGGADRHGAAYWDLKRVMGGACSIHDWANSSPPLALSDHVHLSDEGSRRMGRVMYETLMAGYDRYRQQVDLGSQFAATGAKTSETSGTILKGAP